MRRPWRRTGVAAALAAVLVACGDDGGGPGAYTAVVQGPGPVGAAVVEVRGTGVEGFGPAGDSRVFPGPSGGGSVHRIVVVSPGGELRFRVDVHDLSAERPFVTLISATDTLNRPLQTLADYRIELTR